MRSLFRNQIATLDSSAHALFHLAAQKDWPYVGGDAEGTGIPNWRQIDRSNVTSLQVAWTFIRALIISRRPRISSIQCTPLVTTEQWYLTSADNQVIALQSGQWTRALAV